MRLDQESADLVIEAMLSDMSENGWCASYLVDAAASAWGLAKRGPESADLADSRSQIRWLVQNCARDGWWPEEVYEDRRHYNRTGYKRVPLDAMHQHSPVPGLPAHATAEQVRQEVTGKWDVESQRDAEPDKPASQPGLTQPEQGHKR